MNDYSVWETAQWWTAQPEKVSVLGVGGRVSIIIINTVLFIFALAAALLTH